jgi:hypothetical protein
MKHLWPTLMAFAILIGACSTAPPPAPTSAPTLAPTEALAVAAASLPAPTAIPTLAPTKSPAVTEVAAINGPRTGDAAPDFNLPDSNGTMVQLADELKTHRAIALVFYYAHY